MGEERQSGSGDRSAAETGEDATTGYAAVSRRHFVGAGVATGVGALAAGSSLASSEEEAEADDDLDQHHDVWFDTAQTEHPVDTYHYNFTQWGGTTHVEYGIWAQYAQFDWEEAEFHSHLIENWEATETEFVLELREDITWENGDPVDAEDLEFQWNTVLEAEGNPVFEFVDEIEATDDYELTFRYPEGTNEGIIEHAVLHEQADRAPADWADFDPDADSVAGYDIEEPTTSGPLVLTERHHNYHQFEPRNRVEDAADHPYAENYNWNGYRMRHREGNQAAHQSLIEQDLDGIHSIFVGDETLNEFPDSIEEIKFPGTFGMAMWFNHDGDRPFSDRAARQALAHSVDMGAVIQSIGENKKIHHEAQTGLPEAAAEEWLGGTAPDGFETYEQDAERVEALLEDAGMELGEVNPEFVVPGTWSDWVLMASSIVDQMEDDIGWDVDLNTLGGGYWGARGEGEFDIIAMEHSDGPEHNHPYFSLEWKLVHKEGNIAPEANYEAAEVDLDVEATLEDLSSTQDREEQEAHVRELAGVVNEDLPYLHVAQRVEQSFIDRERWAFPEEHELMRTQWPLWVLPKTDETLADAETPGLLKATDESDEEEPSEPEEVDDEAPAFDGFFDTATMEHPVDSFHYNVSEWAGTTHVNEGIWAQYAHFDWQNDKFHPHLVEDWHVEHDAFVVELREDFTWEDGEPVDAEALEFQWDTVLRAEGHEVFDVVDEVEATDDYELTFRYPAGSNGDVVKHAVLHERADRAPADWADFDPEEEFPSEWDVEEPTTSGPLTLTEQTDDYHQYEPRNRVEGVDDHPYAQNYNWGGYRMRHREGNQAAHESLIDQELDGMHNLFLDDDTLAALPDTIERLTFPSTFGMGLWFNHDDDRPFSDRAARQALAHSVDVEAVLDEAGYEKIHHEAQTGLTENAAEEWLGSTDPDGFDTYEQDAERVEELLEDTDLELGEVEPELFVPGSWSDWAAIASVIVDQLEEIGWDITLHMANDDYWEARDEGEYDVIAMEHTAGRTATHPHYVLQSQLVGDRGTVASQANYEAAEVDVDVEATLEDLASTQGRPEQETLVRKLALVVNEDLPYLHVSQQVDHSFVDREHWQLPDDHPLLRTRWPLWVLPKTDWFFEDAETKGLLKAREGSHSHEDGEWFDTAQTEHPVETFHYNTTPWVGTTHANAGIWAQYAHFDWQEGEFHSHLVEDWHVQRDAFVLELRDDITWENGEPVDADALEFQWETILRARDHPAFEFVDDVEATDDYELTFHYPEGTNGSLIEHAVLHEQADRAPADWADFDPDSDSVAGYDIEEPTTSGPLALTERTDDYHQFEPRNRVEGADDHPYAEHYDFRGYRMRHREGNQAAHHSLIEQDLDGIHSLFVGDGTLAEFPDTMEELRFPGTFGMGLWFNHDDDRPFSDRAARQALAHSVDLQEVIDAMGDTKIHHEAQTGMTEAAAEEWLGATNPDGFDTYERDPERVEELLDDADLELGEVEPEFVVPGNWSDWVLMASQIVDQMEEIGWDVDLNTLGGGYWGARGEGEFDLIAMEHSDGPEHNHPYFSLEWKLVHEEGNIAPEANYEAAEVDLDVEATLDDLSSTQDREEQEAHVRELAGVVNEDLPYLHVAQKYEQSFIDGEHWEFPEEHELLRTQWPLWVLPKTEETLDDAATPGLLKSTVTDCETIGEGETERVVCDLDGDGNYRDVTNSGSVTLRDLETFFGNQHVEPWDSRTDLFDYTDNDEVSQVDVVDLFEAI